MIDLPPAELFQWADKYARRHEAAGHGTKYPTVRQAKRRFKGATLQDIEGACDCYDGAGYLGIATGFGIPFGGHASIARENDYLIEAYL